MVVIASVCVCLQKEFFILDGEAKVTQIFTSKVAEAERRLKHTRNQRASGCMQQTGVSCMHVSLLLVVLYNRSNTSIFTHQLPQDLSGFFGGASFFILFFCCLQSVCALEVLLAEMKKPQTSALIHER